MKKKRQFLKSGLFEKDFMQTKITTHSMSFPEKLLGYALGPGFVMVYTTIVASLREMFYMSVMPIDQLFGSNSYMTLQTSTTIIGVIMGLVVNYITERTVSRAGRFRPYVLIGTILMAFTGVGMFWSPFANGEIGQLVWLYIVNILYFGFATVLFKLSDNILSVSTRSVKDRNFATVLKKCICNMIPGIFVSLLVTGWLYYVFLVNDTTGDNWRLFVSIPAIIGIVAAIVEYFHTRERITEENRDMTAAEEDIQRTPLLQQVKQLLTNKYYLLAILVSITFSIGESLQGVNARTYFCQWILGADDTNGIAMLYLIVSMQPMAIGAVIIPMLTRKMGSRKILIASCLVVLAGLGVAVIEPSSFAIACAGGLVFSMGMVAMSNMSNVFTQQAADMIEHKHSFRFEGTLAAGLIAAVYAGLLAPFSAVYETVLHNLGFDAYAAAQNEAVNNWIVFAYYGGYAIQAVGMLIALIFFDAEKKLPKVHEELKERRKAAILAQGREWVDEEEYERRQREEAERIAEENRIADLKEKCAKKGLDFEKENAKYLAKKAKKQKKAAARK